MTTKKIGDTLITISEVPGLTNYRGDRVLGLSCTSGKVGYIKILKDLSLPEFWRYLSGDFDGSVCSVQKKVVMRILGLSEDTLRTIINTPERAKEFLMYHEESHILHHDSDNRRLNESGHLSLYRIGIEARATWEAWVKLKNKYKNGNL